MCILTPMSRHAMNGALSRFRLDYPDLDQHIDRFSEWLLHDHSGGFGGATSRAYTSAVRSVLVRMLIDGVPPSVSLLRAPTSGVTAWRLFLAFTALGGLISDGTPDGSLDYKADGRRPVLKPEVAQMMRRHTRTALGDYYARTRLDGCVRRLWRYARPNGYGGLMLGTLLRRNAAGLYVLDPEAIDGPELPSRFRSASRTDTADLEAALYLALWSHAGTTPDPNTTPLFLAVPAIEDSRLNPPAPLGMWDACGRPSGVLPALPREGWALLAGEAVDLSGVAPLHAEGDAALLARASNPRWSGHARLTPDDVAQEHREVLALHDPRPAGWALTVNVTGVPPLGEGEVLTVREEAPRMEADAPPMEADGKRMGIPMEEPPPDVETPPPAEPAEAFDAPEWPGG